MFYLVGCYNSTSRVYEIMTGSGRLQRGSNVFCQIFLSLSFFNYNVMFWHQLINSVCLQLYMITCLCYLCSAFILSPKVEANKNTAQNTLKAQKKENKKGVCDTAATCILNYMNNKHVFYAQHCSISLIHFYIHVYTYL